MAGERESQIQQIAGDVLKVGDTIIKEKSWPKGIFFNNLAAHLRGNLPLGQQLREAQEGQISSRGMVIGFGGYGLAPIGLAEFQSGTASYPEYYQQVSQLLAAFIMELGFLKMGEDLSLLNTRIKKARNFFPDFTLNHPTKPFTLGILGNADEEGRISPHNIIIKYRPRVIAGI